MGNAERQRKWRTKNKEHSIEYLRNWRKENLVKKNGYQKIARAKKQKWVNEYKAERGCSKCSETDPVCLDFHHLDPATKSFGIHWGAGHQVNQEKMLAEIQKCIIICANCHRKLHAKEDK